MLKSKWVLLLAFCCLSGFAIAEEHSESTKAGTSTSTTRPEPEKKKSSLYQKLSACINERPSSTDTDAKDSEKPTWHPSSDKKSDSASTNGTLGSTDGQAIFTQYCATCHSVGGSQGPISNWALAAERAGVDMPPQGRAKTIPAADLAKLKEFLIAKSK